MKFSKGDILIACDAQFPEGAVVVDGYDKGGRLLAHPMGGGPQLAFTEVRLSSFRAVAESEQRGHLWRKAAFSLDGLDGNFPGWTCGMLWNGWAMPQFEPDVARRIVEAVGGRYLKSGDYFLTPSQDGDPEEWARDEIELLGGQKLKVYPVGAGSWIWDCVPQGQTEEG